MVRKILEVKELARVQKEELIMQSYNGSQTLTEEPPKLE